VSRILAQSELLDADPGVLDGVGASRAWDSVSKLSTPLSGAVGFSDFSIAVLFPGDVLVSWQRLRKYLISSP
jgi:hypothetical protein